MEGKSSNGCSPRRRADLDDEIEEGEICYDCYVSGSETDDDQSRDVLQPRDGNDEDRMEYNRRRLEDAATEPLLSDTPSPGLEVPISNSAVGVAAAAATPTVAREVFACRNCQEFDTRKAVDGHTRVHRQRVLVVPKDEADISGSTVAADPIATTVPEAAQPQPMATARTDLSGTQGSSSGQPIHNATAATVAPAANPPNPIVDHQQAAAPPQPCQPSAGYWTNKCMHAR